MKRVLKESDHNIKDIEDHIAENVEELFNISQEIGILDSEHSKEFSDAYRDVMMGMYKMVAMITSHHSEGHDDDHDHDDHDDHHGSNNLHSANKGSRRGKEKGIRNESVIRGIIKRTLKESYYERRRI